MKKGHQLLYPGGLAILLLLVFAFLPGSGVAGLPFILIFGLILQLMMVFIMGSKYSGMHGGGPQDDQVQGQGRPNHSNSPALPSCREFLSREDEVAWLKSLMADLKTRQVYLGDEMRSWLDSSVVLEAEAEAVARAADERLKNNP